MEEKCYVVEITPEAECFYFDLLAYLFKTHHPKSASRKADDILELAMSLKENPFRGSIEHRLKALGREHRFLLYEISRGKDVKIIYFIENASSKVYVTDFFGTKLDDQKIGQRTK